MIATEATNESLQGRLLFIDDEQSFLNGIKRMLHDYRRIWDISCAIDVDSALDLIRLGEYDLIISDIRMPGRDGFDLLSELDARQGMRAPILMLTGIDDHDLKRRALNMGAYDLLFKPVRKMDLVARIESLLRMSAYQNQLKQNIKSLEREIQRKSLEIDRSRIDLIFRLAQAAEARDLETGNHIIRVGHFGSLLAENLGQTSEFVKTIFLAGPLHDIGKIGIPDQILKKRGQLTRRERYIMQQHCIIGSRLLLQKTSSALDKGYHKIFPVDFFEHIDNPVLEMAASIALTHHERWDGSGYPLRLKGDIIPLEARIVAVADVYDALSHKRVYKPAYTEKEILEIMYADPEFDPDIMPVFERSLPDFRRINREFHDE